MSNLEIIMGTGLKSVIKNDSNGVELECIKDFHGNFNLNYHFGTPEKIEAKYVVNCAGLYSDKIAQKLGVDMPYKNFLLKGYYVIEKWDKMNKDFPTQMLYPIPPAGLNWVSNDSHTTIGEDYIKIGPVGFPGFWRENYSGTVSYTHLTLPTKCRV